MTTVREKPISNTSLRRLGAITAVLMACGAIILFGYLYWNRNENVQRAELLANIPTGASSVFYLDFAALRQSPFLAALYKWAPQPAADQDYLQFVRATGFDYERDLNRMAVAISKRGQDSILFAVADGRFDQRKIIAYASQAGTKDRRSGREVFFVPASGSARRIAFSFLGDGRIALATDGDLPSPSPPATKDPDAEAWQEHFRRLAGSPAFAVIRQDAISSATLAAPAPGGWQSPQLSGLLSQLQWISMAAKPEGDRLLVVLEGECASDAMMRQLSDLLNGVLALAQAGLADSKMREQLEPGVRQAYLELLKSADVTQIDRGETKSVRLVFDLTPKILEAVGTAAPFGGSSHGKTLPDKAPTRN
jgi:hypothetical protein